MPIPDELGVHGKLLLAIHALQQIGRLVAQTTPRLNAKDRNERIGAIVRSVLWRMDNG